MKKKPAELEKSNGKRILVIEASTSSAKAMLYCTEQGVLDLVSLSYSDDVGTVMLQTAENLLRDVVHCVKKLQSQKGHSIDIIALVSVWHSLLLLDANRNPQSPIYTWADTSAASVAASYRNSDAHSNHFYHQTGCNIHSIYPLWKLLRLQKEAGPTNLSKVFISSLPEYLFEQMTGGTEISYNVASGTGFLNIHTLDWEPEILKFAGIHSGQLGQLSSMTHNRPLHHDFAKTLGLNPAIPVVIAGADGAMNQIGEGLLDKNGMSLSIGTSAAMRIAVNKPRLPEKPSVWCYYAGEKKWLVGAATAGAGNCIDWFLNRFLKQRYRFQDLENELKAVDRMKAPVFLPFLFGERCPGWEDRREGGFNAIRNDHQVADFYYALLEGILFNIYQNLLIINDLKLLPESIIMSGGIVHSTFWQQMAADILQSSLQLSTVQHSSMMGAVGVAMKTLGLIDSVSEFVPSARKEIIPHQGTCSLLQKRFEIYLDWYDRTRPGL